MNDIYSVNQIDYQTFVEQIKPSARDVHDVELSSTSHAVKIFSKKTGKCLCSRISYKDNTPEKYYIFTYPDDDERQEPIPKLKLNLETREEVQAFFTLLSNQMKKEKKND